MNYPLIMAHAGGDVCAKENSVEAIEISNKHKPDIIELDVRKSKDGVLYCYHGYGFLFFNFLTSFFLRFRKFNIIKRKKRIFTLKEVLSATNYNPILYFDIKESNISSKDIENVLNGFVFNEIYIASFKLGYLIDFKRKAEINFKYAYQLPVFFINRFLNKYKNNINMIKVWRWDIHKVPDIRRKGYEVKLFSKLYSFKKFISDSIKIKSFYICHGDVVKMKEIINSLK